MLQRGSSGSPGPPGERAFHIAGDALCLDFANTVSWRRSDGPIDRLATHRDLVSWTRQAGLVSRAEADRMNQVGARHRERAAGMLVKARTLREIIFQVFAAVSENRSPEEAVLSTLNDWLRRALRHSRVVRTRSGYVWDSMPNEDRMEQSFWAIARSAGALLMSAELGLVGQCSGRDCRWLFLDRTRNRSRRWCDMAVCGNRAKANRHYERHSRRGRPRVSGSIAPGKPGRPRR